MALSESAIKRNRQANKRKAFIKNEAIENDRFLMGKLINKIVTMFDTDSDRKEAMEKGMEENTSRVLGSPFNRAGEVYDSALTNAAELGLMGVMQRSKGSSAKKKTKRKQNGNDIVASLYKGFK